MDKTGRTYESFTKLTEKRKQTLYAENTDLLSEDGTLAVKGGYSKNSSFVYDRNRIRHKARGKEWDFFQISNGRYMVQLNFANISIGGYVSATLVDLRNPDPEKKLCAGTLSDTMSLFLGGRDKYPLEAKPMEDHSLSYTIKDAWFEFKFENGSWSLKFRQKDIEAEFSANVPDGLEPLTTVLPFKEHPDRYFMTTKANSMPCRGYYSYGGKKIEFEESDTTLILDWGRVCTPYSLVWYWGNGSTEVTTSNGEKHMFGFEITWGIGCEDNVTETAIFWDGKLQKIGAVDVETFPKPDGYMKPWKFISDDNRFNLTMTPFYDHHSDLNFKVMRMHSHQVHGMWNGNVVLENGETVEIRDMYAFCEYVENRW